MFVNLDKYGNTSAASVPIALAEAVNEGRVKVGDNDRHRRLRRRLHVRRRHHRMDRRPGARPRGDAAVRPRGRPRPTAGRLGLGRPDPATPSPRSWPSPGRSTCRSTTSSPASPSRAPPRRCQRMIDLSGKSALVTGGSRGIGRAIATAARDPGRRRRVQLPRQRRGRAGDRGGDRGARPAGARRPGATLATRRPRTRSSRPRSRRSARSTSSSTTPASPATT